jgi:hypothetical protein
VNETAHGLHNPSERFTIVGLAPFKTKLTVAGDTFVKCSCSDELPALQDDYSAFGPPPAMTPAFNAARRRIDDGSRIAMRYVLADAIRLVAPDGQAHRWPAAKDIPSGVTASRGCIGGSLAMGQRAN